MFIGSVPTDFHWYLTDQHQRYATPLLNPPFHGFRLSGLTSENLIHFFSYFNPDGITLLVLLLPFPGIALMFPTWAFSRPHTFCWLGML